MSNIIDFKSMVTKLRKIDPTSFEDMKKQIVESVQTAPEHEMQSTPVATLRKLSGMPEMSKKSIKKVRKTVDKMDDKPKVKKSISKWAKGKFDDPKAAMFAIATNMQKRKQGKKINPPGRESISHIGKALIDEPKTLRGKLEEAMRSPNFVLENLKYQGEFDVGMKVKAFDHQPGVPGREDKYIEGEIIAIDAESKSQPGSMGYHVKVEKDTLFTKNSRVGKTVFVPYEISMDYDERISKIDAHLDHMNVPGREYDADDEAEARALSKKDKDDEARAWARSNEATGTFIGGKKGTAEPEIDDEEPDNPDTEYGEYWRLAKEEVKNRNRLGLIGLIADLYEKLDAAGEYINTKNMEGKMSDIDLDMKELKDQEFLKKHGKTKEEMKASLSEVEKDPKHEALVDKTIKTLETYLDLVSKQGNEKLSKATEDVRKVFGMEEQPDVPKDHEYGPLSDKSPKGKRGYKSSPGARTAHLKTVKKHGKKKRRQGDKISIEAKNKLLDIGKAIREKAQEQGLQPAAFLGYLVAKNPKKYGALAKLEGIIDGRN